MSTAIFFPILGIYFLCVILLVYVYGGYLIVISYLARGKENKREACHPTVTFVIPAFNEERMIERKIRNTLSLDYPREKITIIVVDDGSDDATPELCQSFAKRNDLVYIRNSQRLGKAGAMNRALKKATSELFVVSDANGLLEPSALRELVKDFSDEKVGAANGRILPQKTDNIIAQGAASYYAFDHILREAESRVDSIINVIGKLSAYRTMALEQIGGFDGKALVEDMDSSVRLRKAGWKITFNRDAIVYETVVQSLRDFNVQKIRRTVGTIQTVVAHRGVLFNPKLGIYGLFIYPSHRLLPILNPFIYSVLALCLIAFFTLDPSLFILAVVLLAFSILVVNTLSTKIAPRFLELTDSHEIENSWILASVIMVVLMQYVLAVSWLKYLTGRFTVKWDLAASTR